MGPSGAQTLALSIGIGSLIAVVCARLRFPAVLPLLIAGIVFGRSGLNLVDGASLGPALQALVAVLIGLLVFEGCLHLDRETFSRATRAVWGLLTIGALTTWLVIGALAHYLVGLPVELAAVLGAILIVTGPTVVQPILKRVPLTPPLHTALSAEAVLIDPIGVIATVATLEVVLAAYAGTADMAPLEAARLYVGPWVFGGLVGGVVGWVGAWSLRTLSRRGQPGDGAVNLGAMSACTLAVGAGEALMHEAGLVAATVCGVIMANARVKGVRELHKFNEHLAALYVGALFVLLGSQINLESLRALTERDALFVAGVMLLARPLSVVLGTLRSKLNRRERVFAMLFAPRGIVAFSAASLVAARFAQRVEGEEAMALGEKISTLALVVIFVSVTWAGVFGGPIARLIGVRAGKPTGVLFVGANALARRVARKLADLGVTVRLVDTNPSAVIAAKELGLQAYAGDATEPQWLEEEGALAGVGWVVTMTGNNDVDAVVARWANLAVGEGRVVRLAGKDDAAGGMSLGGRSLAAIVWDLDRGALDVEAWTGERADSTRLVWVDAGKVRFQRVGGEDKPGAESGVVGLVKRK